MNKTTLDDTNNALAYLEDAVAKLEDSPISEASERLIEVTTTLSRLSNKLYCLMDEHEALLNK